ncbi:MAG TPA: condensation domain-containing protein, partial [Longimicrobiaceae bacterium]
LNAYGPTECSDDVTHHPVHEPPAPDVRNMPIGRQIANVRLYLVDAGLDPVPAGVPGELLVGGICVGRGYAHDPARTAETFVPDPFSAEPGGRLYRTGDRVRLLPSGDVEFLGRIDFQVKIRGFRIELGEIESVLAEHPAVRQAAVAARETERGDRRLFAWLVADPEAPPSVAELRAHLGARLPEYMVPAAFVVLDALPLNANGKLDRRALPAPDESALRDDAPYLPPADEVERRLAAVWESVLRVERVGREDNFFELGGDSILAIQVVSRARQEGLVLTPRDLFRLQTLAELATAVEPARAVDAEQGPVVGPVELTPIQDWFLGGDPEDPHHFNQSLLLEASAPLDAGALERAAAHLPRHHDALRLRFRREAEGWRARIEEPGESPYLRVELAGAADEAEAVRSACTALQAGLELERGPLFRVAHLDAGPGRPARVLLLAHHLAVDGVSWRVLLEDLGAAYAAEAEGAPVRLPRKTTSWKSWAARLRARAASPGARAELPFWLEQARPAGPPLPLDHPGGENTFASERAVTVSLDVEETRALLHDALKRHRAQADEVLLAALAEAVRGWAGGDALRVDLETHGREELFPDADTTRTVGWFTAEHPLRLAFPAGGGPEEALRAVREALAAVPSGGVGYGLLRHLAPADAEVDELRARPRPEVLFNYLGQLDGMVPEGAPFRLSRE